MKIRAKNVETETDESGKGVCYPRKAPDLIVDDRLVIVTIVQEVELVGLLIENMSKKCRN